MGNPHSIPYDIAIIGAGSAGVAAAVTAARAGCRTLLVERSDAAGGIPVHNALSTICGLYVSDPARGPTLLNEGFPTEFAHRLMRHDHVAGPTRMGKSHALVVRPDTFRQQAHACLAAEKRLTVAWNTSFRSVALDQGALQALTLHDGDREHTITPRVVIDCTGTAEVCEAAGEICSGSEAELTPAIVFPAQGVPPDIKSRPGAVKVLVAVSRAVRDGDLPAGSDALSITPNLDPGSATIKLNLGTIPDISNEDRRREVELEANRKVHRIMAFLRNTVEGYEQCTTPRDHYPLALRRSRNPLGLHVLTGEDVRTARHFEDGAARGCWPIEKWDAGGRCRVEYLPEGGWYDIPRRSLRPALTSNLLVAGKCISADADAIASARVVGCCLATGEAAGKMAAEWVEGGA